MMSRTGELKDTHEHSYDLELRKQTLMNESALKQTIETKSNMSLDDQPDIGIYQQLISELKDENIHLKDELTTLRKTVKELEDWNGDYREKDTSKSTDVNIDLLTSRNRQLENDLQRLQLQQRNNQLALERLDEYEETISQLHEELDQLRSNKKKQPSTNNALEDTRVQSETRIVQLETDLKEKFEREKTVLQNQLQNKEKEIEIERNAREDLQTQLKTLQQLKDAQIQNQIEEQENRAREIELREIFERQIIELNEEVQSLENEKIEFTKQLDELRQQLESRDRQIQTFQTFAATPGSPPTISSSHNRDISPPPPQTSELETQIIQHKQQIRQINSIYDQFVTLLPDEFLLSNNIPLSLTDRFLDLYEQLSTYIGTFSIVQEELDSLKQILLEKQDELEKFRSHLAITTDKLTQIQEEQSLAHRDKAYDSEEDELEEILGFHQRAPSRQSLLSITPGEKQQLIAQNELLSSLLTEKEQELIFLQQADKTREELRKNLEILRGNLQQMEFDKEVKQVELNDIRNILDEKLRENSSLKKEKMYFIEKLAEFERDRQEQQAIVKVSSRPSSQEREISPISIKINDPTQTNEQTITEEQFEKLRTDYDQLLVLCEQQHDESISYYNEYTRILALYNDLNTKHSQFQVDYESVQSLIQQKNEAYLQCQNELNTYQNLLYHQKKKSDDIDLLHSTLNERELQLQQYIDNEKQLLSKQTELEIHVKILEENNCQFKSNQLPFEQIQIDLKRITHERDIAIVEKKQLENQMESNRKKLAQVEEREQSLIEQLENLHQTENSLKSQLEQLNNSNLSQTELIDHLNVTGEQSQHTLMTELETLKHEYIQTKELNNNLNNQLEEQTKLSQILQNNFQQFQQEREQYISEHLSQYQDSLREQISMTARLTNENNEIRHHSEESNDTKSSVNDLHDEIKTKDLLIEKLQTEIDCKTQQILEYNENCQTTNDTRVEKQLVKHLLLSYFNTPIDKQQEVIPILSALVGFTQDEYQKAMDAIANNYNNSTGNSWFTGWLGGQSLKTPSDTPIYHPSKSFTELLIQYIDQQSPNSLQQTISKLNTDNGNSHNSIVSTSDNLPTNSTDPVLSIPINVEQARSIFDQSSLPNSSMTAIDDLLKI